MLSYVELCELVEQRVIEGVDPDCINAASIDITLGDTLFLESPSTGCVNLAATPRQYPKFETYTMDAGGFRMRPQQFILASSRETFNLPDDICANYYLKSSLARAGLNAALAMFCDPGWHNANLTLELYNGLQFHDLLISPGMRIGQMVFHRVTPVPQKRSYRTIGSYNGTQGPCVR